MTTQMKSLTRWPNLPLYRTQEHECASVIGPPIGSQVSVIRSAYGKVAKVTISYEEISKFHFVKDWKTNNIKWKNWQGEFVLMVTPLCFVHRLKSENHLTRFHSLSLQSRRYLFAFFEQTKHEAGLERETRATGEGAENFSLCLPYRVCLAIFTRFALAFARLKNEKN